MKADAIIESTIRTTLLCAGLLISGAAWTMDYATGTGEVNAVGGLPAATPTILTGVELHDYLHDPALHMPDNLGNYGEDYRAIFSGHMPTHGESLPKLTSAK